MRIFTYETKVEHLCFISRAPTRMQIQKSCDMFCEKVRCYLKVNINTRLKSQTTKWKVLRGAAKLMVRSGLSVSPLAKRLAFGSGVTALHYAVRRGDMEIVQILLDGGADPYIRNDLGMDVFDYCDRYGPFPNVKRLLQKKKKSTESGDNCDE